MFPYDFYFKAQSVCQVYRVHSLNKLNAIGCGCFLLFSVYSPFQLNCR